MNGESVRIRDLVKVHHTGKIEVQALRGLNLDIQAGELVSIIGPSGSGKSTLLNLIGGLDKATAGYVQVGDKVQVVGPFGASFLMANHPKSHLIMICTGTGSAPMRDSTSSTSPGGMTGSPSHRQ